MDDHNVYPPGPPPLGFNARDHHNFTSRTPSPTPSEVEALGGSFINWRKFMSWRFWARKEWIKWYIIGIVILVITILISVFDKQIVNFLTPIGKKIRAIPFGWLIPVAILFVISFPPLFGHEIIAILVGVIWGLGIGFAIVAAGTFLGEVGNYYAFKYLCRARGEKMEKNNIQYACLAQVVREGGFKMALIIRLSVIPGHFSTAVFSTCGMSIWIFALAAFFSLPKQLITVYIGVILEEDGSAGGETTRDKVVSRVVLAVTILITIGAMWFIWRAITDVKPRVIYARRKARQVKLMGLSALQDNPSTPFLDPYNQNRLSDEVYISSPKPQHPQKFSFLRGKNSAPQGSGYNMGYGGYSGNPNMMQGRYGEPLDDDYKRDEEWDNGGQGYRVGDLRGGMMSPGFGANDAAKREEAERRGVHFAPSPAASMTSSQGGRSPGKGSSALYPPPPSAAPPVLAPPSRAPMIGTLSAPPPRKAAYPNPWEASQPQGYPQGYGQQGPTTSSPPRVDLNLPTPGLGGQTFSSGPASAISPATPSAAQALSPPLQQHYPLSSPPHNQFRMSNPPVTTTAHHHASESEDSSSSMPNSLYPPGLHRQEYTDSSINPYYSSPRGHQQEYTDSTTSTVLGPTQTGAVASSRNIFDDEATFGVRRDEIEDMHQRHAGGGHAQEATDASFYTAVESISDNESPFGRDDPPPLPSTQAGKGRI